MATPPALSMHPPQLRNVHRHADLARQWGEFFNLGFGEEQTVVLLAPQSAFVLGLAGQDVRLVTDSGGPQQYSVEWNPPLPQQQPHTAPSPRCPAWQS